MRACLCLSDVMKINIMPASYSTQRWRQVGNRGPYPPVRKGWLLSGNFYGFLVEP